MPSSPYDEARDAIIEANKVADRARQWELQQREAEFNESQRIRQLEQYTKTLEFAAAYATRAQILSDFVSDVSPRINTEKFYIRDYVDLDTGTTEVTTRKRKRLVGWLVLDVLDESSWDSGWQFGTTYHRTRAFVGVDGRFLCTHTSDPDKNPDSDRRSVGSKQSSVLAMMSTEEGFAGTLANFSLYGSTLRYIYKT